MVYQYIVTCFQLWKCNYSDAYIVAHPDMCQPCKYVLQFLFYFTLAKVVKHKNVYIYNLLFFYHYIAILINVLKKDPYFSMGKKLTSYATTIDLFSWEREGNSYISMLVKTLKHPKVHFLTISPYNALI